MDQQAPEGPGFEKVSEESYYQIVVVLSLFVVDFGFDTKISNKGQKIEINKRNVKRLKGLPVTLFFIRLSSPPLNLSRLVYLQGYFLGKGSRNY